MRPTAPLTCRHPPHTCTIKLGRCKTVNLSLAFHLFGPRFSPVVQEFLLTPTVTNSGRCLTITVSPRLTLLRSYGCDVEEALERLSRLPGDPSPAPANDTSVMSSAVFLFWMWSEKEPKVYSSVQVKIT